MSVNSSMTAIADKIRSLLGLTGTLSLDAMSGHLGTAVGQSDAQADLIAQIKTVLEGKAAGGGNGGAQVKTATTRPAANSTSLSFTGLTAQPKLFAVCPTGNITFSTQNRFVVNVAYDGTTTHGMYVVGTSNGMWNTTYTGTWSGTYFTWTYENGTLTVQTNSTTNGGYFASGVEYQLIYGY